MIPALTDLPAAPRRIVLHWTAGGHRANSVDLAAYHYVVEESGRVVAGVPVAQNMRTIDTGPYAAHVRRLNSYSVGVSLAGMTGAAQGGTFGPAPITERQVDAAVQFLAQCCEAWGLDPLNRLDLLTHAEVPDAYGVAQPGKWDITVLPWDPTVRGAGPVGRWIRERVARAMATERDPLPEPTPVVDIEGDEPGESGYPATDDGRPGPERAHPLLRPARELARPGETGEAFLRRVGSPLPPLLHGVWEWIIGRLRDRLEREADDVLDRVFGEG